MECGFRDAQAGPRPIVATCGGSSVILFMAVLEYFLLQQCDIEDPRGQIESQENPLPEYDFVVVGGGSAGSVVANRLSEVGEWRVLLVEAGGEEPTGAQVPPLRANFLRSSIDWQYYTEPEQDACLAYPQRRCYWPKGKVIGGSSVLNEMIYMRGNKNDYDSWEKMGNGGWSYEEVLPYFLKSENNLQIDEVDRGYHATGGYLPVSYFPYQPPMTEDILNGVKELGYSIRDLNGKNQIGFGIVQTTTRNGVRQSAARSFLRPIKNRKNLDIMLNTFVTKVKIEPLKKVASGIEIITEIGEEKTIFARKEVIVCAGSVNSPQILLLSGVGNKTHLENVGVQLIHDLPGVGQNLHDHVGIMVRFIINEPATNSINFASTMDYLLFRKGPLSSTGLSQISGFLNSEFTNANEGVPDIQILFSGYSSSCSKTGLIGELERNRLNETIPNREIIIGPVVLDPKSRGHLELRDKNPFSHPKIFANYLRNPSDVETLLKGVTFSVELPKTMPLQKYGFKIVDTPAPGCQNLSFGSDEYWKCAIRSNTMACHHQVGSCKMGPTSDPMAVVDSTLRVHGIKDLRVIDASIMPTVSSGNTYIPTLMIAEKGSEMIKKMWL